MKVKINHPKWKDVSRETHWEYHWHHTDPVDVEYRSILLADESDLIGLGPYRDGWTVELYPNSDGRLSRWHFSPGEYDNPEKAAREQVNETMEIYK